LGKGWAKKALLKKVRQKTTFWKKVGPKSTFKKSAAKHNLL